VGTVLTSGIAGVGRTDTITYSPSGFSPVFGTWEVNAASNKVSLSFVVSSSAPTTLNSPIIVVRNYTGPANPAQVTLNGVTLTANSDYFSSLRSDKSELWITLNKKLAGTNSFSIVN
jgi:hypothetical protein